MSIILDGTGEKYHARIQPGIREFIYPKTLTLKMSDWNSDVAEFVPHEPAPWTGEGLPPVGAVCEVVSPGYSNARFSRFIGQTVTVIAHDVIDASPVAVFRMPVDGRVDEQDYHAMVAGCFRPVRTPEQIAQQERERAIEEMGVVFASNFEGHRKDGLQALYDAGYRKSSP